MIETPTAVAPDLAVVSARSGLARAAAQVTGGRPLTITWFGGSVTYGAGLDEGDWGYRGRCVDLLRGALPVEVRSVNAAIGGTGSDLGCFRLRQDALSCRPDLVVVEFSVNDAPSSRLLRTYEGVVRAARSAGADVLTVYGLMQQHLPQLAAGALPDVVALHDAVAAHYGVPSVHIGLPVARDVLGGRLRWEEFASDVVHPTPAGHQRYAEVLAEGVVQALAVRSAQVPLPTPLSDDPWDDGELLLLHPAVPHDGQWWWEPRRARGGWECFAGVLVADRPGAEVELGFCGPLLGLFHTVASDTGVVEVAVDDGPWRSVDLYDLYGRDHVRPHYRFVATDLADAPHTARVRTCGRPGATDGGNRVELAALLVRGPQR